MANFILSPNTQNLINIALANGPGANNVNYVNAYNAISADIQANGTVNSGTATWFANAGSINGEQYSNNVVGAFVWDYTKAAAASEGANVTTDQLQVASNTIAATVFNQLKNNSFTFSDQANDPANFAPASIIHDDAGAGSVTCKANSQGRTWITPYGRAPSPRAAH